MTFGIELIQLPFFNFYDLCFNSLDLQLSRDTFVWNINFEKFEIFMDKSVLTPTSIFITYPYISYGGQRILTITSEHNNEIIEYNSSLNRERTLRSNKKSFKNFKDIQLFDDSIIKSHFFQRIKFQKDVDVEFQTKFSEDHLEHQNITILDRQEFEFDKRTYSLKKGHIKKNNGILIESQLKGIESGIVVFSDNDKGTKIQYSMEIVHDEQIFNQKMIKKIDSLLDFPNIFLYKGCQKIVSFSRIYDKNFNIIKEIIEKVTVQLNSKLQYVVKFSKGHQNFQIKYPIPNKRQWSKEFQTIDLHQKGKRDKYQWIKIYRCLDFINAVTSENFPNSIDLLDLISIPFVEVRFDLNFAIFEGIYHLNNDKELKMIIRIPLNKRDVLELFIENHFNSIFDLNLQKEYDLWNFFDKNINFCFV
eukprot:gene493-8007_t